MYILYLKVRVRDIVDNTVDLFTGVDVNISQDPRVSEVYFNFPDGYESSVRIEDVCQCCIWE